MINYDWLDEAGFGGIYYSLTQVDFNGDHYEKQAIYVNCENESTKLNVYPNPTKGDFTVEVTSDKATTNATLQLTDLTGKVIASRQVDLVEGNNQLLFSGLDLQMGTYIIRIQSELEIRLVKLVVD